MFAWPRPAWSSRLAPARTDFSYRGKIANMSDPAELKALILHLAEKLGFAAAGIAPAAPAAHAGRFRRFLALGCQADMAWLSREPDRRCDVRSLLAGATSVICLACSYAPPADQDPASHVVRYARGQDYHKVLTKRCRELAANLAKVAPDMTYRICVDTAPLLERELAAAAGLGWIGRNGCLIHPHFGSYLLLAEIVTSLPLPPDEPQARRCGSCRACLDACPTAAFTEDGLVDARRCLSYLTLEHRRDIPEQFRRPMGQRVFGCDACQQACPFNRRCPPGDTQLRGPSELATTPLMEMLLWTHADWDRLTRGTAARRAKFEIFLRNAALAAGNGDVDRARPALERLSRHASPVVAQAAQWALRQASGV